MFNNCATAVAAIAFLMLCFPSSASSLIGIVNNSFLIVLLMLLSSIYPPSFSGFPVNEKGTLFALILLFFNQF